jgi:hypothetical protein
LWCYLHVVWVGTTSILVGRAADCPLHHHGQIWSSVSGSTTTPTRLVGLGQAVPRVRLHTALFESTLMVGNEWRGRMSILRAIRSDLLIQKRRRGDASPNELNGRFLNNVSFKH